MDRNTDKDGNQRRVTEVVLQRFRGELTLLDSRNASRGGDDYGDRGGDRMGGGGGQSFGRSSPMERSGGGDRRPAGGGGRTSDMIDDDIPF